MADASLKAQPDRLVGAWLLAVCVMVFCMMMLGGATRLTESGLSITEWKPLSGALPPLSHAEWERLFAQYQQIPQYRENAGMTLADFQYIFWWEWSHRLLGRVIGVVVLVPLITFALMGRLKGRFWSCIALLALGGLEGFLGWWMVQSGLRDAVFVSPVRLAVHLVTAFCIMGFALWLALDAFGWPRAGSRLGAPRGLVLGFLGILLLQVVFGALLAGARGGAAYADWPTIGGATIPRTYAALEPFWMNLVYNHATQQMNHRTLGYVVALLALAIAALAQQRGAGDARAAGIALGVVALAQASLGIVTVMSAAPLGLSLAHQAGAALLWLTGVTTLRGAWRQYNTAIVTNGKI